MATKVQKTLIEELVQHYRDNMPEFETFASVLKTQVLGSRELRKYIEFVRDRIKDPDHLREKLYRKMDEAKKKGREFDYSTRNLFVRINDLAGLRLIHLHTPRWSAEKRPYVVT